MAITQIEEKANISVPDFIVTRIKATAGFVLLKPSVVNTTANFNLERMLSRKLHGRYRQQNQQT